MTESRRTSLGVGAVLAALFVGWWAVRPARVAPIAAPPLPDVPEAEANGDPSGVVMAPAALRDAEETSAATAAAAAEPPPGSVRVRVVDGRGAPVGGVPVALRGHWPHYVIDPVEAVTGSDGIALLCGVADAVAPYPDPASLSVEQRFHWTVELDLLLAEPVGQTIAGDALPTAVVTLVAPPLGGVVVEGVDAAGQQVALSASAALLRDRTPDDLAHREPFWLDEEYDRQWLATAQRATPADGKLRFPQVGLDAPLVAWVRRNAASVPIAVPGRGPAREGETALLRARFDDGRPSVCGRVVGPDGAPLGDATLLAELLFVRGAAPPGDVPVVRINEMSPEHYAELDSLTTDAAGRFTIDVRYFDDERGDWSLILSRDRNGTAPIEAQASLPATLAGQFELGDVTLLPAPTLVLGRVVDESGAPLADATVAIELQQRHADSRLETTSAADGTFALRGIQRSSECALLASAPERAEWRGEATVGAAGLEIVLPRVGAVIGRVALGQGGNFGDLRAAISRKGGRGGDTRFDTGYLDNCWGGVGDDGTFSFDSYAPGEWVLSLCSRVGHELRELDFTLRAGETTDLGLIELGSVSHSIVVHVVDAATGAPLSGGFTLRPSGTGKLGDLLAPKGFGDHSSGADGVHGFTRGTIRTLRPEPSVDLIVAATGHRAVVMSAQAGEQQLRLERGIEVTLKIEDFSGLPPAPQSLEAQFTLAGDGGWPFVHLPSELGRMGDSEPVDGAGTATVLLPCPGRWRLEWLLKVPIPGGFTGNLFRGREHEVTIAEDAVRAEFVVHVERDTSKGAELAAAESGGDR